MKSNSIITTEILKNSTRLRINPIRNLTPQSLSRILDDFHNGNLAPAALTWDAIERRDDLLPGIISKRKKATARLKWEILTLDNSPTALKHKSALQYFYNNLSTSHACDSNQSGSLPLLIKQMLDSIAKKYAVHEITYQPSPKGLTASFKFVPLWFFNNSSGKLHFHPSPQSTPIPLTPGHWLTTISDGLMESCSIAYLFKHLPLKDWLIYCERNGMPGVKATTDAHPGSPQWNSALEAARDFGAEFHALMSPGTDIQPIDLSSRGELPYPALIDRMDRAMIALWRGSDLSTLSHPLASGASLQLNESSILEEDDAALISETLNNQVDRFVLNHLFNIPHGKAYFHLQPTPTHKTNNDLHLYQQLHNLGLPLPINHLLERFSIPQPQPNEPILIKNQTTIN